MTGTVRGAIPGAQASLLLWPALLSVVLLWPLLTRPGHPLARDLVFVPSQPMTWAAAGLGDGSPRAVPLDAIVAALTSVVDGECWRGSCCPRSSSWPPPAWCDCCPGGHRRAAGRGPARRCGTPSSWSASPSDSGRCSRPTPRSRGSSGRWQGSATGWRTPARSWGGLALASVTPTGGLLALATVLAAVVVRGRVGSPRSAVLALQAPWLVAGLVGSASRLSDPAGVSAFAPDSEGRFGAAVAVLGLGGIWDSSSEPASSTTILAVVAVAVVVCLAAAGRELPASSWPPCGSLGLGGLGCVLALTTGPGQAVMRSLVVHVPAAGLLRDAQKFLLPTALLVALAVGVVVDRLVRLLGRRLPEAAEVRLVLVSPSSWRHSSCCPTALGWSGGPSTRSPFPSSSYAAVDSITSGSGRAVVALPWRAYRRFGWGHGLTSSDPPPAGLRAPTVVSDDLQVGSRLVRGEGALAGRVGEVLDDGGPAHDLGALGVGWVVVYPDDPTRTPWRSAGWSLATRTPC